MTRIPSSPLLRLCAFAALASLTTACPSTTGPDGGDGPPAGDSAITIDGAAYTLDLAASKLLVKLSQISTSGICAPTHGHVVEADVFALEGELSSATPADSSLTLTIPAQLLKADLNENRALFEDLADQEVNDSDRSRIQNAMPGEVSDANNPNLEFRFTNLSTLDEGSGATFDTEVIIKGESTTTTLTFDIERSGDDYVLKDGTGSFPRAPFEILTSNPFGGCLDENIEIHLKSLTLTPGEGNAAVPDAGPAFEPTVYAYDGDCVDNGVAYNDEIFSIVNRRCAGCHDEESDYPLVTYNDWRTDSPTEPGRPRFEAAWELMQLPEADSVHMPPLAAASPLAAENEALVFAWFEAGAPPSCNDPQGPGWTSVPRNLECGTPSWDEDIQPMMLNNYCVGCHDGVNPDVPALSHESYSSGVADAEHPFYQPLSLWEASVERIRNETMPPLSYGVWFPVGASLEDDLIVLDAWVEAGYPESPCN